LWIYTKKNKNGEWNLPNRKLLLNMPNKGCDLMGVERYYAFTKSEYMNNDQTIPKNHGIVPNKDGSFKILVY